MMDSVEVGGRRQKASPHMLPEMEQYALDFTIDCFNWLNQLNHR
jgi:hypothetical protein